MTKRKEFPSRSPEIPVRPVCGFEGFYSVSQDGQVWSEPRIIPHGYSGTLQVGGNWLATQMNPRGYPIALLYKQGKQFVRTVHRLVAESWIPRQEKDGDCINHKNGIKSDNRAENLEWVTQSQNVKHAYEIGLRQVVRRFSEEEMSQIRLRISSGERQRHIAQQLGVSDALISVIKTGNVYKRRPSGGRKAGLAGPAY